MFDEVEVNPRDISSYNDVEKLPVLSKKTVLENEQNLIDSLFKEKLYTRKTGGSTGLTLHFMKERKASALNDAIMYSCCSWYHFDISAKQVRFWGVPVTSKLRMKEQLKDFIVNRIRTSAFDISESYCLKQYERIKKFKLAYFYVYTTVIFAFSYI